LAACLLGGVMETVQSTVEIVPSMGREEDCGTCAGSGRLESQAVGQSVLTIPDH